MTGSLDTDLLTIGHSNLPADQFLALLKAHGVTAIADVRSVPFSRRFPWFSSRTLAERLQSKGIAYVMMGDTLGGRPVNPALYCDGIADYEAMAGTADFHAGLDRVIAEMTHHRLCLMCAEREPLDCHRCLLVAGRWRGSATRSAIFWATARSSPIRPPRSACSPACGPRPAATCSATANCVSPRPIAAAPAESPPGCPTGCGPGGPPGRCYAVMSSFMSS